MVKGRMKSWTKNGVLITLVGVAFWYWSVSDMEIKTAAQWLWATVLLYASALPGLHLVTNPSNRPPSRG